ncbi:hypothetical protein K435DRAFT_805589 [Dendrothele bispora CBS 962.96]|uniref:Uncharacterized protein n=1 Tax=Dendrothele bispora (strain CBS 962.96) TaxID=1314807 RepID=A0A4S8LAI2_DENBC|nr:hypothetical protein K435DRAFT_805589 [Dendrothele bispora CBS 962.96]
MDLARVSAQLRQSSAKSVGSSGNPSDYHPRMRIDLKATHHPSGWHPNPTQSDPVGALVLTPPTRCCLGQVNIPSPLLALYRQWRKTLLPDKWERPAENRVPTGKDTSMGWPPHAIPRSEWGGDAVTDWPHTMTQTPSAMNLPSEHSLSAPIVVVHVKFEFALGTRSYIAVLRCTKDSLAEIWPRDAAEWMPLAPIKMAILSNFHLNFIEKKIES